MVVRDFYIAMSKGSPFPSQNFDFAYEFLRELHKKMSKIERYCFQQALIALQHGKTVDLEIFFDFFPNSLFYLYDFLCENAWFNEQITHWEQRYTCPVHPIQGASLLISAAMAGDFEQIHRFIDSALNLKKELAVWFANFDATETHLNLELSVMGLVDDEISAQIGNKLAYHQEKYGIYRKLQTSWSETLAGVQDQEGNTVFHFAARANRFDVLYRLIQVFPQQAEILNLRRQNFREVLFAEGIIPCEMRKISHPQRLIDYYRYCAPCLDEVYLERLRAIFCARILSIVTEAAEQGLCGPKRLYDWWHSIKDIVADNLNGTYQGYCARLTRVNFVRMLDSGIIAYELNTLSSVEEIEEYRQDWQMYLPTVELKYRFDILCENAKRKFGVEQLSKSINDLPLKILEGSYSPTFFVRQSQPAVLTDQPAAPVPGQVVVPKAVRFAPSC